MHLLKKLFFVFIGAGLFITLQGKENHTSTGAITEINLNGTWKEYKYVPTVEIFTSVSEYSSEKEEKYTMPSFDDSNWSNIEVPFFKDMGVCWYRKKFLLPDLKGKSLQLKFGSVRYRADVFLNGHYLGSHEGGLGTPFEFDATSLSASNSENLLAVRVTGVGKRGSAELWEKYKDTEGFFPAVALSDGMWQNVKAVISGAIYVKECHIISHIDTNSLEAELTLYNTLPKKKQVDLKSFVIQAKGNSEVTGEKLFPSISLNGGEEKKISVTIPLKNPIHWSPENPYLYMFFSNIIENGNNIDSKAIRFGFREFKVKDNDFYLNGKKYYLRGMNYINLLWNCKLMLPSSDFIRRSFIWAKGANVNTIRTGFFPPEQCYDIADELGLMLIPQFGFRLESVNSASTDSIHKSVMRQIEEGIKCIKNHPSWIMSSLMGEQILQGALKKVNNPQDAERFIRDMHAKCHELSPLTPVIDGNGDCGYTLGNRESKWLNEDTDVFSAHYYPGWYHTTAQYYFQVVLPKYLAQAKSLNKPFAMTETDAAYTRRPAENGKLRGGYGQNFWPRWVYAAWHQDDDKVLEQAEAEYQQWLVNYLHRGHRRYRTPCVMSMGASEWFETAELLKPLSTYYVLKDAFSPILISIECYKRNYFPNDKFDATLYLINDYQEDKELNLQWTISCGRKVIKQGNSKITIPLSGCVKVPVTWEIPVNEFRDDYTLSATISNDNKIVSKDDFSFVSIPKDNLDLPGKKILLYDTCGKTEEILKQNKVEYRKIENIASLEGNFDLLIIGAYSSIGKNYKKEIKRELSDCLALGSGTGKSILVLEQGISGENTLSPEERLMDKVKNNLPNGNNFPVPVQFELCRYDGADNVTIIDSNHPAFSDLLPDDFSRWNGNYGIMGKVFFAKSKDRRLNSLVSLSIHSANGFGKILDVDALKECKGEFNGGVGHAKDSRIIFNQLDAVSRYDIDPVARKYLNNLIRYCLE